MLPGKTIASWRERIPELLRGHSAKMFGILMKLDVFGVLSQSKVLEGKVPYAREGKGLNKDLRSLLLLMLLVEKNLQS